MRGIGWIVAGAAAVSLAGCYTSDTALITPANADYPIAKTSLTWTDYSGDKMDKPNPDHSTSLVKDGYYQFTDSKGMVTRALFKKAGGNFYIVEEMLPVKPGDSTLVPIYALTRIDGKNVYTYNPTCTPDIAKKFKAAIAKTDGDANMPTCHLKDMAGLNTVMTSLETTPVIARSSFQ